MQLLQHRHLLAILVLAAALGMAYGRSPYCSIG